MTGEKKNGKTTPFSDFACSGLKNSVVVNQKCTRGNGESHTFTQKFKRLLRKIQGCIEGVIRVVQKCFMEVLFCHSSLAAPGELAHCLQHCWGQLNPQIKKTRLLLYRNMCAPINFRRICFLIGALLLWEKGATELRMLGKINQLSQFLMGGADLPPPPHSLDPVFLKISPY